MSKLILSFVLLTTMNVSAWGESNRDSAAASKLEKIQKMYEQGSGAITASSSNCNSFKDDNPNYNSGSIQNIADCSAMQVAADVHVQAVQDTSGVSVMQPVNLAQ